MDGELLTKAELLNLLSDFMCQECDYKSDASMDFEWDERTGEIKFECPECGAVDTFTPVAIN